MAWKTKTKPKIICSLTEEETATLSLTVQQKIKLLMKAYPSQEWLSYLVGSYNSETRSYDVRDIVVPPHASVTSTHAEAEPFHVPENCLGVLHSHHSMGAFHSTTDHDHVDANWPLSITAATRGSELEFDAVSQSNTPCGKSILLKCKIMLVLPQTSFDAQAFLKEAKANIDKGRKVGAQVKRIVPQNFEDFKSSSKYIVAPSGEIIGKHDLEPIDSDGFDPRYAGFYHATVKRTPDKRRI